ncbi:hypothetical protein BGZ65_010665, partial [Modicella reniformis]
MADKLDPIRIIRLPNVQSHESRDSGKVSDHQLPEQLAVMYACLNTGDMDRARRIFITLHKNNPDDMLVLGDIRMHNSFIESYMNASPSPRTKEALKWFELLSSKYSVKPDLTSFAILIRGFIKMDSMHLAKVMMIEMQRAGFTVEDLRGCPDLQVEDVKMIDTVARLLMPVSAHIAPLTPEPISSEPSSEFVEVNPVKNFNNETVIGVKLMRNTLDALNLKNLTHFERQQKLEEKSYQAALDRMEYERTNMPDQLNVQPLRTYLWRWHQELKA